LLFLGLALLISSIHQVPEGHVGVYWLGGAIDNKITDPGFHLKLPLLHHVEFVQYTLQTDTVKDIPCGTSGGVIIMFDKIEVVNRLSKEHALTTIKLYGVNYDKTWIFDKIHHEINQFCSSHSLQDVYITEFASLDEALLKALQKDCDIFKTGIEIIAIRVTKPRIPRNVLENYERVEEEKTRLMVATQQQLVSQKEGETTRMIAKMKAEREMEVSIIDAEKEASVSAIGAQKELNVSRIQVAQSIAEKEGLEKMELIQNNIHTQKIKSQSDAERYRLEQEAEGFMKKLTPEYLKYTLYQSLAQNTKIFYGDSIPQIFSPWLSASSDFSPNDIFENKQGNL
jgi:regulator of protease activity HflC (stomatin/prohibitin superfamily)